MRNTTKNEIGILMQIFPQTNKRISKSTLKTLKIFNIPTLHFQYNTLSKTKSMAAVCRAAWRIHDYFNDPVADGRTPRTQRDSVTIASTPNQKEKEVWGFCCCLFLCSLYVFRCSYTWYFICDHSKHNKNEIITTNEIGILM